MKNKATEVTVSVYRLWVIFLAGLILLFWGPGLFPAAADEGGNGALVRDGERIYRQGILPSGKPVQAFLKGDIPVQGKAFACVSCHLRSGLGSLEGNVSTPPTNGRLLFQSRESYIKGYEFVPSFHNYAVDFPVRPAYTEKSLAELITSGVDPTGRSVLSVMPRYELDDEQLAALIAYLKTLSDSFSPGVTDDAIRFATVVVEGTEQKKIDSLLAPLAYGISRKNALSTAVAANDRVARMGYNMMGPDLMRKKFSLKVWTLKGPSATWRQQLDDYYQTEPVFALLSGLSDGDWGPVSRFCEERHVPHILPIVTFPTRQQADWYTLYFSRGPALEGATAARYLAQMAELFKGQPVLQVVRDERRSQAMAQGFQEAWQAAGQTSLQRLELAPADSLSSQKVRDLAGGKQPAALVVWDSALSFTQLNEIAKGAAAPGLIIASGSLAGENIRAVPESLRQKLYYTYPYRLPQEDARYDTMVRRVLRGRNPAVFDQHVLRQAYIVNELLGMALMNMRGEYYRDFFLDTIDMMPDAYFPLYERLSFGPGQRYTVKGCFIVQLSDGATPELLRRSEWAGF